MRFFRGPKERVDEWDSAIDAFENRAIRPEGTDRFLRMGNFEVAAERRAFLIEHPWSSFRERVGPAFERAEAKRRLRLTFWFSAGGFATSMAALLAFFVIGPGTTAEWSGSAAGDGIGLKGEAAVTGTVSETNAIRLHLFADEQPVHSGQVLPAAAELTFQVDTGDYDHVMIFGVEDSGVITPYYPESQAGRSLLLGRGSGHRLPDSVVLDGVSGRERFVALFSETPLLFSQVQSAVLDAWRLSDGRVDRMEAIRVDAAIGEESIWFEKRP